MNMQTARLANVAWLSISDGQAFALRAAWFPANDARPWAGIRFDAEPQRLPMLDWPQNLFEDEVLDQ
jgi:hypothetical protein